MNELELTEKLFRENLESLEVIPSDFPKEFVELRKTLPNLRWYAVQGRYPIPIDLWERYEVKGLTLTLRFKKNIFKDGTNSRTYEYESLDEIWNELDRMIEWAGK